MTLRECVAVESCNKKNSCLSPEVIYILKVNRLSETSMTCGALHFRNQQQQIRPEVYHGVAVESLSANYRAPIGQ